MGERMLDVCQCHGAGLCVPLACELLKGRHWLPCVFNPQIFGEEAGAKWCVENGPKWMIWGLEKLLDESCASSAREMKEGRGFCRVARLCNSSRDCIPGGFGAEIPEGNQRLFYKMLFQK